MKKLLTLKEARAILPKPVLMKSASPAFLAWFRQLGTPAAPMKEKEIVKAYSESKEISVRSGKAQNESQRLLDLGDWAAGVAVMKVNWRAKSDSILPKLGIALFAYESLLSQPPVDLGKLQLKEIKKKQDAALSMYFIVFQDGHIKANHVPSIHEFERPGFHSLF